MVIKNWFHIECEHAFVVANLSYKIRRFNSLIYPWLWPSPHTTITRWATQNTNTFIQLCTFFLLIDALLILCSNFHSLIDMFNACDSSETDYCRATAQQCTISRPVLLIGELCDWTVIMKCLQMQCNWQPIICLFISLLVCISNFFICLQSNSFIYGFDDDVEDDDDDDDADVDVDVIDGWLSRFAPVAQALLRFTLNNRLFNAMALLQPTANDPTMIP